MAPRNLQGSGAEMRFMEVGGDGLTREHPIGNTPPAQHPSRIGLSGACATGQKYLKKPSHYCSTTIYIFDLAAALRQEL
jgi:hypothetical protein